MGLETQPQDRARRKLAQSAVPELELTSSAFADGARIPERYTSFGENISPALTWSEPPSGTESLALVCDDPDSRAGSFVHWLVWNIDPSTRGLPEGWKEASAAKAP